MLNLTMGPSFVGAKLGVSPMKWTSGGPSFLVDQIFNRWAIW